MTQKKAKEQRGRIFLIAIAMNTIRIKTHIPAQINGSIKEKLMLG
jgi:hypothetical protein